MTCLRTHWYCGGRASSTPWDSPRPKCLRRHWFCRGRATSTSWDSSTPQCHPRPWSLRGGGPAGLAIRWSANSGCRWPDGAHADGSAPLCSHPSVERPPDVVQGPTEVVSTDRFPSQVLLCLKILRFYQFLCIILVVFEKFSVSILASSQKWATATPQQPRQKLSKGWPLCKQVSISHHTPCASWWAPTLWIPASARPPSTACPGDR